MDNFFGPSSIFNFALQSRARESLFFLAMVLSVFVMGEQLIAFSFHQPLLVIFSLGTPPCSRLFMVMTLFRMDG